MCESYACFLYDECETFYFIRDIQLSVYSVGTNTLNADVGGQMAQVERLESKLNLMVFMGQFDELVTSLRPV